MEDKELKELFAASRTVEANRRRQAELRRRLEASAAGKGDGAKRNRRRWPVWVGSAAASVALVLLTVVALQRPAPQAAEPMARVEAPVREDTSAQMVAAAPIAPSKPILRTSPRHAEKAEEPVAEALPMTALAVAEESPTAVEPEPEEVEETVEPVKKGPRIHRRTSTRLVNNNNTVTVQTELTPFQEFLASALCTESNSPTILKTIVL